MPDLGTLQIWSAWLLVVLAAAALATTVLGLRTLLTGRDTWPTAMRGLRRRVPASDEDNRLYGVCVMLRGAATAVFALALAIVSSQPSAASITGGQYQSLVDVHFLLGLMGIAAYLLGMLGAHRLSQRIRYVPLGPATQDSPKP